MWGGREFSNAVLAFAGGVFTCLFVLVLLSADRMPSFCTESDVRCLRDWVGALSGWAAAVAAGGTIIFLRSVERRKDLLDWRATVISASFIRTQMEPHIENLERALLSPHDPEVTLWAYPELLILRNILTDAENQEFRRASVKANGILRNCVILLDAAIPNASELVKKREPLVAGAMMIFGRVPKELRLLLGELTLIEQSARNPEQYRGI